MRVSYKGVGRAQMITNTTNNDNHISHHKRDHTRYGYSTRASEERKWDSQGEGVPRARISIFFRAVFAEVSWKFEKYLVKYSCS